MKMTHSLWPLAFRFAAIALVWPALVRGANEIGSIEHFALAADREGALKQLIPGTEEYYFFHALHLQNQAKRADFTTLLGQWAQRTPDSGARRALETRQALLDYGVDPKGTLDFLARRLGLLFNHEREIPSEKPNLPTALDPKRITEGEFWSLATQGVDHLDNLSERAIAAVVGAGQNLTAAQRRAALAKLTRPDVPNLVAVVAADLATKESKGFGEFPIHSMLTLAQLDELRKARADLGQNQAFVLTYLAKLAPGADEDAEHDGAARGAWLDRAWAFVKGLGAPFHSLKAHLLYQRLDHDRKRGVYDPARFLEYVKLPRQAPYISPLWQKDEQAWRFPADLNADFSAATARPPIGTDAELVREYLLHLLASGERFAEYAPYFEETGLKASLAEARLTAGVDDPKEAEQLASFLTPEAYEALKRRVDLDFDRTNPDRHAPGDAVSLQVWVKNAAQVTIKIFELNTAACYEQSARPIGTDIDLDGLVAATQRTIDTAASPLRRAKHVIPLPEIGARRGVWVVELIGNGRSSRALIRKGRLGHLARASSAGTALSVLDEKNEPLKGAYATFAGRRIDPAENGEIVLPFTAQPGEQPVILHDGTGFASLETIELAGEAYGLEAGFHFERESLLAGGQATLAVRPRLLLNGNPVSVALLDKVQLILTSTDLDGIATTATIAPFKLADGREATHQVKVPDRLATVAAVLTAEVKSLSEAKVIPVRAEWVFAVNGIDKTPQVSDLFLGQAADGWFLEERGKNGETKPERAVNLQFWHRDYGVPVTVSLKTGADGRLALGALPGIGKVAATAANGTIRQWTLIQDAVNASSNRHVLAGEPVRVAAIAKAAACSLLEMRGDSFVKDWSANLADSDGFVEARDLPPGDYQLHVRPEGRVITLRVTQGQRVRHFLVSPARLLEASAPLPLHLSSVAVEGDQLVIRISHADALTRVHVAATRYEPAFPLAQRLGGFPPPELMIGTPGVAESQYVSGRQLGDEFRYILERLAARHIPGVMLPRPGLLLNPWAVRDTTTEKQDAKEGERYRRLAEAKKAAMAPAAPAVMAGDALELHRQAPPGSQDEHSLDFLAAVSPMAFNGIPDQDGVLRIPLASLAGASQVHVLALNAEASISRTVTLPAAAIPTRDLRLTAGLDPQGHFAQRDEVVIVEKDRPLVLADALSARFETYDHLGRVFTLLRTLSGNETLAEFSFILDWPTFDEKKKRELYSKHACHELSFFLARKDPGFFAKVIQPYLANKKDPTFLDDYLVEKDLTRFLEPWRYGRLNTLERLLLGRRLPNQQAAEVRALGDWLALVPINREQDRRQLETALRGFAWDFSDESGRDIPTLEKAKRELGTARKELDDKAALALEPATAAGVPPPMAAPSPEEVIAAGKPVDRLFVRQEEVEGLERIPALGMVTNGAVALGARFSGNAIADLAEDVSIRNRVDAEVFFRRLGVTQEWAENNYWKLLIAQQNAELIAPNRFWKDYAAWSGQGSFLSSHVAEATRNFSEMMLALAVLDLPFPSQAQEIGAKVDGGALTLTPKTPLLVFHQAVKPAPVDDAGAKLLVSQNFFRFDDRYLQQDGEKVDKFVQGEFLAGVLYGAQVVVTNPTSSTQKLDVLFQIPRGARPANGAKATQSVPLRLEPFHTHTFDVAFYFPKAGEFPHFPVHVSREGKVVAFAGPASFKVVDQLSVPDTTSWAYVSQNGSSEDVLKFLDAANLRTLDLDRIAWRLKDNADFFRAVIGRLADRRIYHATSYSYAVHHNDPGAVREFLRHEGTLLAEAGPWLRSALVDIDPVERGAYEHLEYSPLVNARAHRLGAERTILNGRLREQYQRLLAVLAHKPSLDDTDRLAVTIYLLLQDRIEEALGFFDQVKRESVTTVLPYDYAAAWLALAREDTKAARAIAAARAGEPVDKWREKFVQLLAQIDEIEGKGPAVTTPDDREQTQDALAAKQPAFEFKIDGQQIALETRNLAEVTVNYYLMDLEFLFSTNPFVGQDSRRFAQIVPNKAETVKFKDPKSATQVVQLPRDLQNRNVLVEVVAAGQRKAQAVYANELKVTLSESFGQLQVRHTRDDRPLAKVYVKVFADVNGRPVFYKDGYTDLRGKFDYASLSTDDLGQATRFAILVLSDEHGAVVKEAKPPRQ